MNGRLFAALLCAGSLTFSGCATAPIGFRSDQSGDFVHIHSGMRFPRTVSRFTRVFTHMFDGAGYDIGVGYNQNEPVKIVMTVYVYPSEGKTQTDRFDRVVNEIAAAHRDAVKISESDVQHLHGSETIAGNNATFSFREGGQELVSGAFLFEYDRWLIAYRVTYEQRHQAEAAKDAEEFMNTLSWPGSH